MHFFKKSNHKRDYYYLVEINMIIAIFIEEYDNIFKVQYQMIQLISNIHYTKLN